MSGPVPGLGGPFQLHSSLFFGQDLRQFVVGVIVGVVGVVGVVKVNVLVVGVVKVNVLVGVVVVLLGRCRSEAAAATGALFFGRHWERVVVLAGVLEGG